MNYNDLVSLQKEFRDVFGIELKSLTHPLFGFDVVKFDEIIKTPDGVSCADHVKATYGDDALKMIENMLKYKRE